MVYLHIICGFVSCKLIRVDGLHPGYFYSQYIFWFIVSNMANIFLYLIVNNLPSISLWFIGAKVYLMYFSGLLWLIYPV